jgi:hypothetical protein
MAPSKTNWEQNYKKKILQIRKRRVMSKIDLILETNVQYESGNQVGFFDDKNQR